MGGNQERWYDHYDVYVTNYDTMWRIRDKRVWRSDFHLRFCREIFRAFWSMPPYDDWNKIDEEDEEEVQDTSVSLFGNFVFSHVFTHILYVTIVLWREKRRDFVLYWLLWIYAWTTWRLESWGHQDLSPFYCVRGCHANPETEDYCRTEWLGWNLGLQHSEVLRRLLAERQMTWVPRRSSQGMDAAAYRSWSKTPPFTNLSLN